MLLDEPIESTKKLEDINVKIADFGLSRVNDTDMMTGILGTFVYFFNVINKALDGTWNFWK